MQGIFPEDDKAEAGVREVRAQLQDPEEEPEQVPVLPLPEVPVRGHVPQRHTFREDAPVGEAEAEGGDPHRGPRGGEPPAGRPEDPGQADLRRLPEELQHEQVQSPCHSHRQDQHAALRHPRHGHAAAGGADAGGQTGGELRHPAEQGGGGAHLPLLPVHLRADRHRAHRVRQVRPGLLRPGPQRPGHPAQVRRLRGHVRHAGLLHEQGRAAGRLRQRLHHPRVPQEPAPALQRHDGAQVPVRHEVQRPGAGRQRPGDLRGCHHLLRGPAGPGKRDANRAHAGEDRAGAAAPPAGQPPGRRLPLPQAAAEAGRPAAAGDGARAAGAGDQEDGGHLPAPTPAGDLQGHVLRGRALTPTPRPAPPAALTRGCVRRPPRGASRTFSSV
ncbi:hypothetical protein MATL_G00245470 [Megalops atlanticus]|uniref:Uncharacterized protein n=1 Tax=Megalops atlanticus TaxID=7932 RepID=A0A9D3PC48_MEGAT|nr:hypothetical protein MATL_G00245470 [Megalops atlanticus]